MTDTVLKSLPDADDVKTLAERAKTAAAKATETVSDAASTAGEKVSSAASTATDKVSSAASVASEKVAEVASATVEAARERPLVAAGIAVGVAAVVAGGVYAATKLAEPAPKKPVRRRAPAKPKPKK